MSVGSMIDDLKRFCQGASPAPWDIRSQLDGDAVLEIGERSVGTCGCCGYDCLLERDADFVSAAREAMPILLEMVAIYEMGDAMMQSDQERLWALREQLEKLELP